MINPRSTRRHSAPLPVRAAIELVIAVCVLAVYRAGRLVTNDSVASATNNAERLLHAQQRLTGTIEKNVQQWMLDIPAAIDVLNHYYVFVHFPATTIFLVWAFARHRNRYPAMRNWFVGVTLAAMVIHVMFPLAPPRMLDGYVDTLRVFGPSIYSEDPGRSHANQFAAMPSLHFGWALMVAIGLITTTTGRRRWGWLAHPAITLLAIVATANHYVLDAAVAAALAMVVGLLVLPRRHDRSESLTPLKVASTMLSAPGRRSVPMLQRPQRRCVAVPARATTAMPTSPGRGTTRIPCRDDEPVGHLVAIGTGRRTVPESFVPAEPPRARGPNPELEHSRTINDRPVRD